MGTKSRGKRAKTRRKLKKDDTYKPINQARKFEEGEKAVIDIDPAIQDGMPHPKFQGRTGEIKEEYGSNYKIVVKDKNKDKTLQAHSGHLKKLESDN